MSTIGDLYLKHGAAISAEGINVNAVVKTVIEKALESRKQFDVEELKGSFDWTPEMAILSYNTFNDFIENGVSAKYLNQNGFLALTFDSENETFTQYLFDNGCHFEVLATHLEDHQWASNTVANWDYIPFWLFGGCRKEVADSLDIGMSEAFHAIFDLAVERSVLPGKPPVI